MLFNFCNGCFLFFVRLTVALIVTGELFEPKGSDVVMYVYKVSLPLVGLGLGLGLGLGFRIRVKGFGFRVRVRV
jgi:hypothetical protein